MKNFTKAVVLFCAATSTCLPAMAAPNEAGKIKVGALLATTGPLAFIGVPQERIIRMQVEALNKTGGMGGRPVELTIYDTEGNTTKTAQQLRRLIDSDNVDVILGPSSSGEGLVAVPVVNESKVPMIAFTASAKVVNPVTPYVFQTAPSDRLGVPYMLGVLQKKKVRTLGILSTGDGYGQSGATLVKEMASKFGITVLAAEEANRQDTEMTAQLLRVRQSNADALLIWATPPAAQVILRNAKAMGYNKPIYNSYAAASEDVLAQAGPAANGTFVISQRLSTNPQGLSKDDPFKPLITKIVNEYAALYKALPSQYGGLAYDAVLIVDKAAKSIKGPVTRESLRNAIEKVEVSGANGNFRFSPTNHNGLDETSNAIILMVAKDGSWVVVD